MNRQQAKELAPIVAAFGDGKTIQFRATGCGNDMKRYNIAAAEKMSLYPGTIFSPLIEITEADNGEWVRYEDERYRVTTDDWEKGQTE